MASNPTDRLASQEQAGLHFKVHPRTIQNWLGQGFITGYRLATGEIVVDIDEIERELASRSRSQMRDGRKPYGPKMRVVAVATVATPDEAES